MSAFHEVRFPTDISAGATVGPSRRTQVATAASGFEERNQVWADSKRRYNAGRGLRDVDDVHETIEFFEERRGRLTGFRWRDHSDYKSCPPKQTPTALDQMLDSTGTPGVYQLVKTYGSLYSPWTRTITKPVAGTVLIALNGAVQASGWSVDNTTGIVTFLSPPGESDVVTAGFEFDVPVRFDTDDLEIDMVAFELGNFPNIPIVEVRV